MVAKCNDGASVSSPRPAFSAVLVEAVDDVPEFDSGELFRPQQRYMVAHGWQRVARDDFVSVHHRDMRGVEAARVLQQPLPMVHLAPDRFRFVDDVDAARMLRRYGL